MNSDAGESGGEELDTKFINNKKTKNDRTEQNKAVLDKKALNNVNGKILGKLGTLTIKGDPSANDQKNVPMKLGNNAKEREKMLANMGRFTQSKVDCGNSNAKKPPNPRSNNSKSPMPTAKRDLKNESIKKPDLKTNSTTQKNFLQPGKNIGTKSMKSSELSMDDDKNKTINNQNYKVSKTTNYDIGSGNSSRNNSYIFDIPELEEEEPSMKKSRKFTPLKLSNTSQNSETSSNDNSSHSINSRNKSNANGNMFSGNEMDNKHQIIKNNIMVNRVNLKTLQTEEDTEELELIS